MRGPSCFQLSKTAEGVWVTAIGKGPDARPGSLLLLETYYSLMGGQVAHVAEEEGFASMTNPEVQQVDLNAANLDAPHSRVQLHVLPSTHKQRLQSAFPVTWGKFLLSSVLNKVLP